MSKTTTTIIPAADDAAMTLADEFDQVFDQLDAVVGVEIDNNEVYEQALAAIKAGKKAYRKADKKRLDTLRPFKEQIKAVSDAITGAIVSPLKDRVAKLEKAIGPWADKLEQERLEAERAAIKAELERRAAEAAEAESVEDSDCETAPEVEAATAAAEEAKAALAAATSVKKPKGLTVKRVETCNPTVIAEAIVPREYLSVDLKKVREAFKAGVRDIPGIDLGIKTETRTIAR